MESSAQLEKGYVRIANELWDEVIRRDFTKRQKDILQFVWRLSYGCQNKSAIIPKLKAFELCGVGKTNITNELKYLVQSKVIIWEQENHIFTINKHYEYWQISPVKGWDELNFKELIRLNLSKKLLKQELPKKKSYQINNLIVIKTITFHKKKLLKQELRPSKKLVMARVRRSPKDIKDKDKLIKTNNIYRKIKHLSLTQKEYENLLEDGFPKKLIDSTLDDVENYKKNTNYVSLNLTLRKWMKKGEVKHAEFGKRTRDSNNVYDQLSY